MLIYFGSMTMGSFSFLGSGLGGPVGREAGMEGRRFHRFQFQRGCCHSKGSL